ncbi:MAG TPA: SCO family protein [Candidatus Udaeobacter sp.]|nr:SCO family protein [Candidatus Udaeobacter sp.]
MERNRGLDSILPMGKMLLTVCVAFALLSCGRSADSNGKGDYYDTRGVVRGFSPDRSTVEIQHEDIPGFMPSMTMPFVARDPKQIDDLKIGDAISFRMAVTQKDFWIENMKKIRREDVNVTEPKRTSSVSADTDARLKEGDKMPPFSLTNQNGQPVSLDTFRGQPFVLTFVFTRCPVPNFCPRMSNNFEEVETAIKGGTGALAATRLLSVTLDPGYDTPKVLSDYAAFHHADSKIWTFATGDEKEIDSLTRAFSVYRQNEGGTISHGLATALINRDGRIEKILRGNTWTPTEVIEAIQAESK